MVAAATLMTTAQSVQAQGIGLAFDLPAAAPVAATPTYRPLAIPPGAGRPPTKGATAARQNPRVYQTKAASTADVTAQLPPPPGASPNPQVKPPQVAAPALAQQPPLPTAAQKQPLPGDIALGFPQVTVAVPAAATSPTQATDWMFAGGSDSLVARVVGSAEGTRTATGERTRHYNGHRDPGNGVWNLGTFSYQHGANSPAEADAKQLARLARQENTLNNKAQTLGLQLTLVERLNALDLANQSPAAALNQGGYIDRLYQAQQAGRAGDDAILWARTYAYMNPKTQRWNAPGLGNTYQSIRRDQNRRLQAIASALDAYQIQQALAERPAPTTAPPSAASPVVTAAVDTAIAPPSSPHPAPAPTPFVAPGNGQGNPLSFGLTPSAAIETTTEEGTTAPQQPPASPQLSQLRSGTTAPLLPGQADRILNRARQTASQPTP